MLFFPKITLELWKFYIQKMPKFSVNLIINDVKKVKKGQESCKNLKAGMSRFLVSDLLKSSLLTKKGE